MADFWSNNAFGDNNVNTTPEPVNEEPAPVEETPIVETENEEKPSTAAKETPRRAGKKNDKADEIRKILEAEKALNTEVGLAAAKSVLGTNSSNHAVLIAQLMETKNRRAIAALADRVKDYGGYDKADIQSELTFEFVSDKNFAKTLFGLLNAVAPDRGFGKSTGDARKDARNIASKWGEGIDLSLLDALKF